MRNDPPTHARRHGPPDWTGALGLRRRGVLKGTGLAAISAALGAAIPFGRFLPEGYIPVALAQDARLDFPGKAPELVVLGDKPLVAETPAHLLDDEVTPIGVHYIRNNGQIPEPPADPEAWELAIDGEVDTPLSLRLGELREQFENVTHDLGAGVRRQRPHPVRAAGARQSLDHRRRRLRALDRRAAQGRARGGGTQALGDLHRPLRRRSAPVGRPREAGALSRHPAREGAGAAHTRRLRHERRADPEHPRRAGAPARPEVDRLGQPEVVDARPAARPGARRPGHGGTSYRVPVVPIVPGTDHDGEGFRILESMPVKSLITSPADGTRPPAGMRELEVRGHAWAGDLEVAEVSVTIDFGQSWRKAKLRAPVNRYAWQRWSARVELPSEGYYEVWARAVDSNGTSQPFAAPNWNPGGYGGNAYHRIAILLEA